MGAQLLRTLRATRLIAVWCAALGGVAMTGGFAAASQISGLTVSLVPINSGTSFVNGTFHVPVGGNTSVTPFTLSVRISGSTAAPFDTSVFSTVLSWSAAGGAVVTDLYTATSAGVPSIVGSSVLVGNEVGMVYRWSGLPPDDGLAASRTMNTNSVDPNSERFWAVGVNNDAEFGTAVTLDGVYAGKEVARIRMALAANVGGGSFTLNQNGTGIGYGFYNEATDDYYTVSTPSLTLTVVPVPEPATLAVLLPGLVVLGGVGLRRRMSRRTGVDESNSDSLVA